MDTWGKPYGIPLWRRSDGLRVTMRRCRIACRFYDDAGRQVGPEQSNVAPAIAWALSHGYTDFEPQPCTRIRAAVENNP